MQEYNLLTNVSVVLTITNMVKQGKPSAIEHAEGTVVKCVVEHGGTVYTRLSRVMIGL